MNELTPALRQSSNIVVSGDDIAVTASAPEEMVAANQALIQWCDHKIAVLQRDQAELFAAYEHAKKNKWKNDTLKRHSDLAIARISFYAKMRSALKAGYYIVPNFPVTAFAIRTDKTKPLKMVNTYRHNLHEQKPPALPAGEGEYKNPFPEVWQRDVSTDAQKAANNRQFQFFAEAWKELDFPINMSLPKIMEASSRAMALKVFDDLGILPDPSRKADPVILGRIKDPRSTKYNQKFVSFLIVWHLNTTTI